MHVIATAGHVDHGKSTLVRALTGTDPDRLEEEQRRGLTIELGYCWTRLPGVGDVAFVDVPGHERFLATMLSGVGPVPAVLFVVAADDPWMPQAAEHLAALDAFGVSSGVLAVTRCDLADPGPVIERATRELSATSLRAAPVAAVSGRTGAGLDQLRARLADLLASLPPPDPRAAVRLWVDRCFTVRGSGTVVTGTLPAGRVRVGDTLFSGRGTVRVRAIQSLGRPREEVTGVARVALNVTGTGVEEIGRGSVLVRPEAWRFTESVDVRLRTAAGGPTRQPPERLRLHIGATSAAVHHRPLSDELARIRLDRPLPLRLGDRALLRDPGSRQLWGLTVLDPAPPPLRRRGAAVVRAKELADADGTPDLVAEVARRRLVRLSLLARLGVDVSYVAEAGLGVGEWLVSWEHAGELRQRIAQAVREHDEQTPLQPGVPVAALTRTLALPTPQLVTALLSHPLRAVDGRVVAEGADTLPQPLERALAVLRADLEQQPFAAPDAGRLRELGLDARAVGAAARAGRLLRVADGVVLLPGADLTAVEWLRELPQPFTSSEARVRLGSTRRVVLPLLELLDRRGLTRRLPDDRRVVADEDR